MHLLRPHVAEIVRAESDDPKDGPVVLRVIDRRTGEVRTRVDGSPLEVGDALEAMRCLDESLSVCFTEPLAARNAALTRNGSAH